jgi:hypothetical protein
MHDRVQSAYFKLGSVEARLQLRFPSYPESGSEGCQQSLVNDWCDAEMDAHAAAEEFVAGRITRVEFEVAVLTWEAVARCALQSRVPVPARSRSDA